MGIAFLSGKKSYLTFGLLAAYSIIGGILGKLSANDALTLFSQSMGMIFVRAGIAKK